jgi:hypothetical protein
MFVSSSKTWPHDQFEAVKLELVVAKKKNIEQGPLVRTPELNEKLEYREHSFRSKAAWL